MTILPVADSARRLGIHPKTLHHWLKEAHVPLAIHPTDARMKCVTEEQLQQVARLHGRPLLSAASSPPLDTASASLVTPQAIIQPSQINEVEPASTASSLPTPYAPEGDLIQKLICLETKVVTLQEQLTQLALTLLQERERSVERRITILESLLQPLVGRQLSALPTPEAEQEPRTLRGPRPLHPVEQLARSRMPPLIEYSAPGSYVIISAQEGEVQLKPDSRAWFDWLATLSSFRFVGPTGRFTGHRGYKDGQQTRYWSASRCVRRHTYKQYLGMTESLTIANLERTAARLQSDIDAR
jgi:hypothetical protein